MGVPSTALRKFFHLLPDGAAAALGFGLGGGRKKMTTTEMSSTMISLSVLFRPALLRLACQGGCHRVLAPLRSTIQIFFVRPQTKVKTFGATVGELPYPVGIVVVHGSHHARSPRLTRSPLTVQYRRMGKHFSDLIHRPKLFQEDGKAFLRPNPSTKAFPGGWESISPT